MFNNQICNSFAINYTFTQSPSSFMDVIKLYVPVVKVACTARNAGASPCNVFVHFAAMNFNLVSCLSLQPADNMRSFNEKCNTNDHAGNLRCCSLLTVCRLFLNLCSNILFNTLNDKFLLLVLDIIPKSPQQIYKCHYNRCIYYLYFNLLRPADTTRLNSQF